MVRSCLLAFASFCAFCGPSIAAKPSFHALGDDWPSDISTNGNVVVGNHSLDGTQRAFRWTKTDGMNDLPSPNSNVNVLAWRVSGDGTTILGSVDSDNYRWSSTLGDGSYFAASPRDVSHDGTTIIGSDFRAFWRLADEETEYFVWPMAGSGRVEVIESTPDATTIVGYQSTDANELLPLRWNEERGFDEPGKGLANLSGFAAVDVSADGQTVLLKNVMRSGASSVYLWNDDVGLTEIETNELRLNVMDDSGRLLAGGQSLQAMIWDEAHGFRDLQAILETNLGLADALAGWDLDEVTELSGDGTTFVGRGRDPSGRMSAWAATIPEPSSLAMLALGGSLLAIVNWRLKTSRDR